MTGSNGAAAERDFLAEVVEASGQDLRACLQCGKCSGGCPIASGEVGGPRRLVAEVLYGARSRALRDPTWWRCVGCGTCMTRCPVEIDVSRVATALCELAEREGVAPSEPHIQLFEELFLRSVARHGRVNELRVAAAFNLRTGQPLKDARAALALLRKGALSPGDALRGRGADARVSRVFSRVRGGGGRTMKASYYPGCSLETTGKGYDRSTRAVCAALGVELEEARAWVCCGSSAAAKTSRLLSTALSGVNLALLEAAAPADVVAPCPFCYRRLAGAQADLNGDAELKAAVEEVVSAKLSGALRIRNLVDFLRHAVGLDAITARVERPLSGLKVVPYYGCSTVKPRQVTGCADPEDPTSLDEILRALGAEVLAWDLKTECCGAGLSLARTEVVAALSGRLAREAAFRGADVIAVACPLCQTNLDLRQGPAGAAAGAGGALPVVYFTQLMGLAFGLGAAALGLDRHLVDPRAALERRGLVG